MKYSVYSKNTLELLAQTNTSFAAEKLCKIFSSRFEWIVVWQLTSEYEKLVKLSQGTPESCRDVILRDLLIRILERKISIQALESELADTKGKIYSTHYTKVLLEKQKILAGMKECQRLDEENLDKWRV